MPVRLKGNRPRPGETDRRFYMIDFQEGLRRVRLSSGTRDKALAERKEQEALDALRADPDLTDDDLRAIIRGERRGRRIAARRGRGATLGEVCEYALTDVGWWGQSKDYRNYKITCDHIKEILGADTPIAAIGVDELEKLRDTLLDPRGDYCNSTTTVRKKLSAMNVLFKAAEHKKWLKAPFPTIRRPRANRGRVFIFDPEVELRVFAALRALDEREDGPQGGHPVKRDAHEYIDLFLCLRETGLRHGEALNLRWSDVRFEDRLLRLWRDDEIKNGKRKTIPMTDDLVEVFKRRLLACPKVGPFANLNMRRANDLWAKARSAAGIADRECVPHAFRHTAGTLITEATGDIRMAQLLLGHTNLSTTTRYEHMTTRRLREGMKLVEEARKNAGDTSEPVGPSFQDRIKSETDVSLSSTPRKHH